MKSQLTLFKWLTTAVIIAMLLQFAFVPPSASAQGQEQAPIELSDGMPDMSGLLTGDPTVPWIVQVGSTGTQIYDIGTDTSGNVYVTGTVFSASDQDAFVAKMDMNGNILWNYSFQGMTSDVSSGIDLDPSGNVFVTGGFRENNTTGTQRDIFLARLSNDGSLLWKTTWGAANRTDAGNELALDEMGNIYITGVSNASWGSPIKPHSLGAFDAFAAKFDRDSGALIWNTFLGENLVGVGRGIEADSSGNVYVTGESYVLTQGSNTSQNAFVAGLNTNGGLLWYTALGNTGLLDISLDIALDETENIYITGESRASWGAPLQPFSGEWDVFVAKLTSSGGLQWNTFVGGNGSDFADGIDVDDTGNIYLAGSSSNTWGSPFSSGTGDPQEVFSAKLESNGTLAWNTFILGTHPSAHGAGHNVIAVQDRSIYVANHLGIFPSGRSYITKISDSAYDCSGQESELSNIGQAVLAEVESDQEYCGNQFDSLIILPPGEAAFKKFGELASKAKYEIDFTTMIWDEQAGRPEDVPGKIFLKGVKELYDDVQANPENYPGGVRVRILIGIRKLLFNGYLDQRIYVMRDMENLGIEFEDTNWKVEVALYRDGDGDPTGLFGTHSHVKLMIVDGKTIITGGYNMQSDYLNDTRRDMGVEVSGPIVTRALMVFDEIWMGASRCDAYAFYICLQEETITDTSHNQAILTPVITGNDAVFSLFRDKTNKTADNAIEAAINAADNNVNIVQSRFMNDYWNPPQYAAAILNALHKGDAQVAVNLLVSGSNSRILDDLALSTAGICTLRDQFLDQDPIETYHLTARFSSGDKPIHTKALSLDGSFIIVGSQNFDASAWGENVTGSYDELGDLAEYSLGIDSKDAASEFNESFDQEFNPENGSNDIICPFVTLSQTSLQNVINQASPGSVIFIPAGIYTESVTINKPLIFVGAGPNQTIIQPEGSEPAFRVTSSNITIMNMKISGGSRHGIELIDSSPSSLKNIQIYRVIFENNAQAGVSVQGLIPGSPMNYAIENSTFIGGTDGITINMIDTQAETSLIRDNIFSNQSAAPIHIISANDSRVEYSYNLFYDCGGGDCATSWLLGNSSASSSAHGNLFDLNPLFSSPETGAYQPSNGSPAIDAGDPSLLLDLYYDGDNDGTIQIDIGAFEYVPFTNVPPVVTAGNDQTVELENSVTVNALYSDSDNSEDHSARINWGDGIFEDVQTNMTGPGAGNVTGQHTYTSPGIYTVEICVVDIHGAIGCDTLNAAVLHRFTGWFPPLDNQPALNVVKAGSTVPVKFSLDGDQGLNVLAPGYPASAEVTCGSSLEDAIEQTMTAGASSLSYDAETDKYIYVWKTDKLWAGTCRTFVLKLNDGSYHRADFEFKK